MGSLLLRLRAGLLAVAVVAGAAASNMAAADTFFVDPAGGSDRASGRSPDQAWRTLERVNGGRFDPGDSVLFKRGGAWRGELKIPSSGRPGKPITFDAYGTGADPALTGGRNGINANGQSHVVVRNLQIRNTLAEGIVGTGVSGWVLDRLTIDRTGQATGDIAGSGIRFERTKALTVSNSKLTNVNGMGMWIHFDIDDLRLLNNRIGVVTGPNSDPIHMGHNIRNFEIRGNHLSMDGPTDSGKGVLLVQNADQGVIADNILVMGQAGNFGLGGTQSNTIIENNRFIGSGPAKWAAAILLSDQSGQLTTKNTTIRNNVFDGNRVGIYVFDATGTGETVRENLNIVNNTFKVTEAAFVADGPVQYSGSFKDNVILGEPGGSVMRFGGRAVAGQEWAVGNNVFKGAGPSQSRSRSASSP